MQRVDFADLTSEEKECALGAVVGLLAQCSFHRVEAILHALRKGAALLPLDSTLRKNELLLASAVVLALYMRVDETTAERVIAFLATKHAITSILLWDVINQDRCMVRPPSAAEENAATVH